MWHQNIISKAAFDWHIICTYVHISASTFYSVYKNIYLRNNKEAKQPLQVA